MTERLREDCDAVLVCLMATLDGERPPLATDVIESHLQACVACRDRAADLEGLRTRCEAMHYTGPRMDLWPTISERIDSHAATRREWMGITVIAVICIAWRTGQLLFELPLPVLNGLVPLAALVLIAAWLVGDPLAIKMTAPELRREGA